MNLCLSESEVRTNRTEGLPRRRQIVCGTRPTNLHTDATASQQRLGMLKTCFLAFCHCQTFVQIFPRPLDRTLHRRDEPHFTQCVR